MILLMRLLPYALLAGSLFWVFSSVYQSGVDRERNRYAAFELQVQKTLDDQRREAELKVQQIEESQQSTLMEVQNAHTEKMQQLNRTIGDLSRRGLYVSATRCEDDRLSETEDPKDTGLNTTRGSGASIRLPETTERDLWAQVGDAAEVVELYRACRAIVRSPVCNVELVE